MLEIKSFAEMSQKLVSLSVMLIKILREKELFQAKIKFILRTLVYFTLIEFLTISFAGSEIRRVTSEFSLIELSLEMGGVDGGATKGQRGAFRFSPVLGSPLMTFSFTLTEISRDEINLAHCV